MLRMLKVLTGCVPILGRGRFSSRPGSRTRSTPLNRLDGHHLHLGRMSPPGPRRESPESARAAARLDGRADLERYAADRGDFAVQRHLAGHGAGRLTPLARSTPTRYRHKRKPGRGPSQARDPHQIRDHLFAYRFSLLLARSARTRCCRPSEPGTQDRSVQARDLDVSLPAKPRPGSGSDLRDADPFFQHRQAVTAPTTASRFEPVVLRGPHACRRKSTAACSLAALDADRRSLNSRRVSANLVVDALAKVQARATTSCNSASASWPSG